MFNSPSFDNTLESFTFSNTDNIDHFILTENGINSDLFFEEFLNEVNFLDSGSTVNLNFEDVIFLLSELR